MKIIWMTDPHILPEGQSLLGHDCAQRLRIAVSYVSDYHHDADFCIISGDLTDAGDAASYQLVNEIMSECGVPTLSIPGNHDDRDVMREQMTFPESIDPEFIPQLARIRTVRSSNNANIGFLPSPARQTFSTNARSSAK